MVSQWRQFCDRPAAVLWNQFGAQSGRLGMTNVAAGWARGEHPERRQVAKRKSLEYYIPPLREYSRKRWCRES